MDAEPGARGRLRHWLWERRGGYPSIFGRRRRLNTLARALRESAA